MSFKNLNIQSEYRSFEDNIVDSFYLPILKESVQYDRAVGFFSSTVLIEMMKGLKGLIRNEGKMRLIISPKLSEEDIEAILAGYEQRSKIIELNFLSYLSEEHNEKTKQHLNLLAKLIAYGILDIKIAIIEQTNSIGMFHEKMGILKDKEKNIIAFTGSMNETINGLSYNYESIDVFKSWTYDNERVQKKVNSFDKIWNNEAVNILSMEFSETIIEKINSFKVDDGPIEKDLDLLNQEDTLPSEIQSIEGPFKPSHIKLRDYQEEAIEAWESNDFKGIFDMATGTGKTITGLSAATHLAKILNGKLAIIIVCPYQHLVNQWVEDIQQFNMRPIIAHSASRQKNWKKRLQQKVEAYNLGILNHFCLVTTNATFSTENIQKILNSISKNLLLIVDEAHNFGAINLREKLLLNATYRLALSATIHRHNDEIGTESLFEYFGTICLEYTLEEAIENEMLTPYYYYPIPVFLENNELNLFKKLTSQIAKMIRKDKFGRVTFSESAQMLLLKRAKIIAGAQNKLNILEKIMADYQDKSHILVYCGAATIQDPGYSEIEDDVDEVRQIELVTRLLGNKLKMKVSKFTSEESAQERHLIKKSFENNEPLQALVAIKCLDEGVNIPSIKTAFILASSTNPKEYIQRRGRVLRKFKGKEYAEIYDFITLPMSFERLNELSDEEILQLKSLPKREIERMQDFARIAVNSSVADGLIENIRNSYLLNRKEINDDGIQN
ncbi:DEAD/DEAH box helicase family protein [Kurthia huakuii]|uniref:DEAD/DEAH box helicase family protein n=1 Tax=Kurthia huakuii TaxID=1421019 RepID=UPI0004955EB0|nr:DEAD/DEAH box helicase family protein [Kurthia huakuii]MBM7700988.1 superfamily II DNA or RNA helicase [Kurthia huakuii]